MTKKIVNKIFAVAVISLALGVQTGCKKKSGDSTSTSGEQSMANEPERIKVQHILVAFKGSLPGQAVERSQAEAQKLADELLEKARGDKVEFEALVKEFSSDRPPGIYEMTNFNAPAAAGTFPRDQMVPGFGDTAFKLKVGEVGIATYDSQKSPFGFHIIKRLN